MRFFSSNVVRDAVVMTAAIVSLPFAWGRDGIALPSSDVWTAGSADLGRFLKPLGGAAGTNPPFTTTSSTYEQVCPFHTSANDGRSRRLITASPAVISNGVIKLGVNPFGNLNIPGTIPVYNGIETRIGLRLIIQGPGGSQLESEATSFGCECEVRVFMISVTATTLQPTCCFAMSLCVSLNDVTL
jgi:hypothetical protein